MVQQRNSLRICLISYRGNPYCGGQGIYIQHLARELVDLGHEVTVLVGPPYPTTMDGAQQHRLPNKIFFGYSTAHILRRTPVRELLSPLNLYEYASSRFGVFPEPRAFSLRAYLYLRRTLSERRFDIFHDNQCLGYGLLLMRGFGIPILSTIHHPLSIDRSTWFEKASPLKQRIKMILYYPLVMQKIVSHRLDGIVTVSEDAALQIHRAFGIPRRRIRVVYNGLDADTFRPAPNQAKVPGRLIFVGNVGDRKKGVVYLLEALSLLDPPVHLVIVDGGTPARVSTEALVRRYGLQGRVTVTGKIGRKELVCLYSSAQIAVVPSLYEGFGFPAAEAMACELPVIATRAGALPELVGGDGHSGLLVPPRNARALAGTVAALMQDPVRCTVMGMAARRRIVQRFTWRRAAQQLVEIYKEIGDDHR
jgi:glycosyltransferase involved in cell wall biosynthesis